ncbi:hypothetical protein HORIV_31690 [Vreelandella olivaria]|uniref:Uncharacterized protein n=1 Tax=Vreelandella olivaria TaxID=390919 RepID=A0ABM7GJB8_9GAMM|nr:hypothetical protein HORIV_31690 [Halomonas olivaria]
MSHRLPVQRRDKCRECISLTSHQQEPVFSTKEWFVNAEPGVPHKKHRFTMRKARQQDWQSRAVNAATTPMERAATSMPH